MLPRAGFFLSSVWLPLLGGWPSLSRNLDLQQTACRVVGAGMKKSDVVTQLLLYRIGLQGVGRTWV